MENTRKENAPCKRSNPQTLWAGFKGNRHMQDSKKHRKETRGKLNKKVNDLEQERKAISNNKRIDMTKSKRAKEEYLAKELEILIQIRE